ncbi:hypothetical protein [Dyella acidisoli]|uniref:TnsA endonuclease N-terminal domain-containing protein n=1 Tax=Dyella acidisoli TaxID=1867834 RepID=A0ABQ5XJV8_9GAMM|nr:hypothetical protein [Dyella acidisoli]GLQ91991.1 hypothetical protein GCM10007901_09420 [Dyella acidisoli]
MRKYRELKVAYRNSSIKDRIEPVLASSSADPTIKVFWNHRRVPLSYGRHHTGYLCAFLGQPMLRVESALERRVLRELADDPSCQALATQPATFEWHEDGHARRYTPDALVLLDHPPTHWAMLGLSNLCLVEVKPPTVTIDPKVWELRRRIVAAALGLPLVRLPSLQEVHHAV